MFKGNYIQVQILANQYIVYPGAPPASRDESSDKPPLPRLSSPPLEAWSATIVKSHKRRQSISIPVAGCHQAAIATNGVPEKVVIDKSEANLAGLRAVNTIMNITGTGAMVEIRQIKYLNNILEQDRRFIKRITRPMMGFKAFHSAADTIAGIEVAHMIRKNQFTNDNRSSFQIFAEFAA
uniref:Transposase n=1 Tax=Ochrobactrum sp. LM19 TaxID=1449781 RepID=A0A0D5A0Y2_9HYPH|nr:transposase [Ochrobactrum sp. LM19]